MFGNDLAIKIFKELGYCANERPTSDKEEADLLVSYGSSTAIIEVKTKWDDPVKLKEKNENLAIGKVYVNDEVLGRHERISEKIRKAAHQLRSSFNAEKHNFSILMYIASGINVSTKRDQIIDTLYGSTKMLDGKNNLKTCYFYRSSDFIRRHTELDAAIVGYDLNGAVYLLICLNPYSKRYDNLKASEFLLPFCDSIIDPIELEKSGKAYMPDADVERGSNGNAVQHNLQAKYGIWPCAIDLNSPEYTMLIP